MLSRGDAQKTQRSDTGIGRHDIDRRPKLGIQDYATNGNGVNHHQAQLWQGQSHLESEFNHTLGDSTISVDRINELDWPDVFEQVSWEALFHGDGNTTTDMANLWR
jgi:hypothetical protein